MVLHFRKQVLRYHKTWFLHSRNSQQSHFCLQTFYLGRFCLEFIVCFWSNFDQLLGQMVNFPSIEFSSIGQILHKYPADSQHLIYLQSLPDQVSRFTAYEYVMLSVGYINVDAFECYKLLHFRWLLVTNNTLFIKISTLVSG